MSDVLKSTDYQKFIYMDLNRDGGISMTHVRHLADSISKRNLLWMFPVIVNENYEIFDGQHRAKACEMLGIPIEYKIQKDLVSRDIIRMNTSKNWVMSDYLNFYVKQHHPEYLKLDAFMRSNGLTMSTAINLVKGRTKDENRKFKDGEFVFNSKIADDQVDIIRRTVSFCADKLGIVTTKYMKSRAFWSAMSTIIQQEYFNEEIWFKNLNRMIERIHPCPTSGDYLKMLSDIHNRYNSKKIEIEG